MAKVKSSNASKSGKSGQASSVVAGSIKAKRGDQERTFKANTWNMLPPDKEGWVEILDKPAPVKTTDPVGGKAQVKEKSVPEGSKEGSKEEVKKLPTLAELEAVDTSKLSSAEKRKHTMALKAAKAEVEKETIKNDDEVPEGMIAVTVDQEFLDTHPDVASKGIVVGQIIHVEKED